jgi:hypothetical protein
VLETYEYCSLIPKCSKKAYNREYASYSSTGRKSSSKEEIDPLKFDRLEVEEEV